MKLLVLAAGYATRLYPLTLDKPKPLLPVAGKPMVEHVLSSLLPIPEIDEVFIVTNARFATHFDSWSKTYRPPRPVGITVVNDGTTTQETRLGAIGDLHLVLVKHRIVDDLLVVAGDNLFDVQLDAFGDHIRGGKQPVLGLYDVKDLNAVKKYSEAQIDRHGTLVNFIEKPPDPKSTLIGIALYYYPSGMLSQIRSYIAERNDPDQPGRLIQWLFKKVPVDTWTVPGLWFDIGSKETLDEANAIFSAKPKA